MIYEKKSLATEIGIKILRDGGNAADACGIEIIFFYNRKIIFLNFLTVGMAAALNVLQPTSTGIGGDCFCLFYNSKSKKVFGLNSSGRAPSNLNIDRLKNEFGIEKELPKFSVQIFFFLRFFEFENSF